MTQEEIDAMLKGAQGNMGAGNDTADEPTDASTIASQVSSEASGQVAQAPISGGAEVAVEQLNTLQPTAHPVGSPNTTGSINFLLDVPLDVTVELGRTKIALRDMLQLGPGSVIELDKLIGEPVDLLVNDKLIAKGEVVVFDENFGVRITDIINPEERIKSLG
ncbi:flagellar motor switch protein FliN [Candidatus Poribacteria bacterium]